MDLCHDNEAEVVATRPINQGHLAKVKELLRGGVSTGDVTCLRSGADDSACVVALEYGGRADRAHRDALSMHLSCLRLVEDAGRFARRTPKLPHGKRLHIQLPQPTHDQLHNPIPGARDGDVDCVEVDASADGGAWEAEKRAREVFSTWNGDANSRRKNPLQTVALIVDLETDFGGSGGFEAQHPDLYFVLSKVWHVQYVLYVPALDIFTTSYALLKTLVYGMYSGEFERAGGSALFAFSDSAAARNALRCTHRLDRLSTVLSHCNAKHGADVAQNAWIKYGLRSNCVVRPCSSFRVTLGLGWMPRVEEEPMTAEDIAAPRTVLCATFEADSPWFEAAVSAAEKKHEACALQCLAETSADVLNGEALVVEASPLGKRKRVADVQSDDAEPSPKRARSPPTDYMELTFATDDSARQCVSLDGITDESAGVDSDDESDDEGAEEQPELDEDVERGDQQHTDDSQQHTEPSNCSQEEGGAVDTHDMSVESANESSQQVSDADSEPLDECAMLLQEANVTHLMGDRYEAPMRSAVELPSPDTEDSCAASEDAATMVFATPLAPPNNVCMPLEEMPQDEQSRSGPVGVLTTQSIHDVMRGADGSGVVPNFVATLNKHEELLKRVASDVAALDTTHLKSLAHQLFKTIRMACVNIQGRPPNGVRDRLGQLERTCSESHELSTANADMVHKLHRFMKDLTQATVELKKRVEVTTAQVIGRAAGTTENTDAESGAQLVTLFSGFQEQLNALSESVGKIDEFRTASLRRSTVVDKLKFELHNERAKRELLEERINKLEELFAMREPMPEVGPIPTFAQPSYLPPKHVQQQQQEPAMNSMDSTWDKPSFDMTSAPPCPGMDTSSADFYTPERSPCSVSSPPEEFDFTSEIFGHPSNIFDRDDLFSGQNVEVVEQFMNQFSGISDLS